MAEPVRSLPADGVPDDDPFYYGSRWTSVRLPGGEVVEQQIPLTQDDLLDPELGDEVTQGDPHFKLVMWLVDLLGRHFSRREDVHIAADLKMLWGIPGLPRPAPDVAVIPGLRGRDRDWTSFDVQREGTRPCLVIEVASAKTRSNDYEKKVRIYERAGIPEYLILDPPSPDDADPRGLLTGYRLGADGRYRRIEPDEDGFLLSLSTGLRFGFAEDQRTPRVLDAATGERLLSSAEELELLKRNR